MATGNSKEVKLQGRSRPCQGSVTGNKEVPWLNVSGVWLEELGFHIGDTIRIIARDKLLIIEPLEQKVKEAQQYKAALQQVKQTLKRLVQ